MNQSLESTPIPPYVVHLATDEQWKTYQETGCIFPGPNEQFIHCSTFGQVSATLQRFFSDEPQVHLLVIPTPPLHKLLKMEDTLHHGALFPHVYGNIPIGQVIEHLTIKPNEYTHD